MPQIGTNFAQMSVFASEVMATVSWKDAAAYKCAVFSSIGAIQVHKNTLYVVLCMKPLCLYILAMKPAVISAADRFMSVDELEVRTRNESRYWDQVLAIFTHRCANDTI